MKRRKRRSLADVWFANIEADREPAAPPVTVPKPNRPRRMPDKTGPLHPIHQSPN